MSDQRLADELTRRSLIRRAGGAGALLTLPGLLAACGDDGNSSATKTATTAAGGFAASAGHDIPAATVRFGLKPFGDSTFYVIGMKRGFFDDVGITVDPKPTGLAITPDTQIPLIIKGEVDIATMNGPTIVKSLQQVPDLRMLGFADTYVATFLLASPDSGVTAVSERIKAGADAATAIKEAMQEIKGKAVGFNNAGSQRVFLNEVFKTRGGMTFDDVKLTVTDDSKLVQLAKGGKIQFATPDGAAQNVELLRLGWYPVVSVSDLAELPDSAHIVAASLSHEGPACKQGYYDENTETCLRFVSVMFRLIDEINADMDGTLPDQAPYLKARSGVDIGVSGLKQIFTQIDPLTPFEKQDQYWGPDSSDSRHYEVVYGEQIKAAQDGGILPKGKTFKPSDGIIGKQVYETLLGLKQSYDELLPKASGLSGDAAKLAADAKKHYGWRNYLDAYRLLRDATEA